MVVNHWANRITHGIVTIENNEVIPTACAEYPGEMSCSSANIDTVVAEGMEVTAAAKKIHLESHPIKRINAQTTMGKSRSLTKQR